MNPFEMVVIIVVVSVGAGVLKHIIDQAHKTARMRMETKTGGHDLDQRLAKIERRLANLETIVLDREKKQEFERSL